MNVLHACKKRTKEQLITENELPPEVGERIFANLTPIEVDASGNPLYMTTEADRVVERHLLTQRHGASEVESMRRYFHQQTLADLVRELTIIKPPAACSSDTMGTAEMAERLNCTQAHVRRLITTEKPSWAKMKSGKNYAVKRELAEAWIAKRLAK